MNIYLMNTLGLIVGLTLLINPPLVHAEKPADRGAKRRAFHETRSPTAQPRCASKKKTS